MLAPTKIKDSPKRSRGEELQELFRGITERISAHHAYFVDSVSTADVDYLSELAEFGTPIGNPKGRPYTDMRGLLRLQRLGHILKNESPTAISVLEKLVSYTVGTGHTYSVSAREGMTASEMELTIVREAILDVTEIDMHWQEVQEELLRDRLLSTGDVIRWFDTTGNPARIDAAFVDSSELQTPGEKIDPDKGNEFGIEYETDRAGLPDARRPRSYWINGTEIPASNVQHMTHGVDSRDPRGVPLLWSVYCLAKEIDELDYAASMAGIAYAEHTVVKQFDPQVSGDSISDIASNVSTLRTEAKEAGLPNIAGAVHEAKGYQISLISADFSSDGWTNLIERKARRIGAVADVPEFMIHGVADTGSRNTLISAEAPLTRRVQRLGNVMGRFDTDFLYAAAAIKFGWFGRADYEQRVRDLKRRVNIKVEIPIPDTQEKWRREASIIEQYREGLLHFDGAVTMLGHDPEIVRQGIVDDAEQRAELAALVVGDEDEEDQDTEGDTEGDQGAAAA